MFDEDQHATIVAALEGKEIELPEEEESVESESDAEIYEHDEEESHEEEGYEEEYEEEYEEAEEASEYDEEEEEEEHLYEDPQSGHRVPYDRFKQINDRRRQLEDEMAARDRELERMREELNTRHKSPEPRRQQEESEEVFDYSDDDPDRYSSRLNEIHAANQRLEIKMARMELETEINEALEEYPNVPKEFLWDSIAKNGNVQAKEAAARYTEFVATIEEDAIARYLEENGGYEEEEAYESAPPRPSSRSAGRSSPPSDDFQLENLDQARLAMVEYLRS